MSAYLNDIALGRGRVNLATFSPALVNAPLREFMEKNPLVSIRHSVLSQELIRTGLEQGDIDIAITIFENESKRVTWRPLAEEELIALVLESDPLAEQDAICLSELRNRKITINDSTPGMRVRTLLEGFCVKAGFTPDILYEGPDSDLSMDLLRRGKSVFILPASIHIWKVQYDHQEEVAETRAIRRPFSFKACRIVDPVCHFQYGISMSKERAASATTLDLYYTLVRYFESWNELYNSERFGKMLMI